MFEITSSLEEYESKDNIFERGWGGIYFLKDSIGKGWGGTGRKRDTELGINDNINE